MTVTRPPIVLGADPGGSSVGLVVRAGNDLLGAQLVERSRSDELAGWCRRATAAAFDLTVAHGPLGLVAVEDLVDPVPHMGVTSVRGLIDTAAVLGALLEWATADGDDMAVLVPPGGHGNADKGMGRRVLLAAYPPQLVGDRESKGTGRLVHVRAAWDIAAAGARQRRQGVA